MSEATSIDIDSIPVFGAQLPDGVYDVKMINLEAATTKNGDPILKPMFEVTSGPSKGLTHQGGYFLGTYKTKDGKVGSFGVMQIKRDAMELGVVDKLPKSFPLDANAAKRAYHKAFSGAKMRLHIQDGAPSKKDGKVYKETRLLRGSTSAEEFSPEVEEEVVY